MRKIYILLSTRTLLILVFTATVSFPQTAPSERPIPPVIPAPGNIQLPSGFFHERRRGVDSKVGAIMRGDGFTITYDIGTMAGNYAYQYFPEHFANLKKQTHLNSDAIENQIKYLQNQVEWRQRQKVNGEEIFVVHLKDSKLIVSFPNSNANFIAKVDSNEQIADFFLIVLTYQPSAKTTIK